MYVFFVVINRIKNYVKEKSRAFSRKRSERSYWITYVLFVSLFFRRMIKIACDYSQWKKSQRILSECALNLLIIVPQTRYDVI